jgi:hypothetical protein
MLQDKFIYNHRTEEREKNRMQAIWFDSLRDEMSIFKSKISFTNSWNFEQHFQVKFSPKIISFQSM